MTEVSESSGRKEGVPFGLDDGTGVSVIEQILARYAHLDIGRGGSGHSVRLRGTNRISMRVVVSALDHVSAYGRDNWIKVGQALKYTYGEDGREAWDDWSASCQDKFDEEANDKAWATFGVRDDREGMPLADAQSILVMAREKGWSETRMYFGDVMDEYEERVKRNPDLATKAEPLPLLGRRIDLKPYEPIDPTTIIPRDWLGFHHYIRSYVTGTIAPGGFGKSSLVLVEGMSMAIGRCLFTGKPIKRQRVMYWGGEDTADELQRRVEAVRIEYNISADELRGWFFLYSGLDLPLSMAVEDKTGLRLVDPDRDALIAAFLDNQIDVFIADPFVKTHGVSENDNNKIDKVVRVFAEIAHRAKCSVELVHHVRKMNGADVGADDARGGSAWRDALRGLRVINRMSPAEARKARVKAADSWGHIRLDSGKVNMIPPAKKARWFQIKNVMLGNARHDLAGDGVGVVVPFVFPDAEDGLPADAFDRVQAALGDGMGRLHHTSPDWVGYKIGPALGMTVMDPEGDAVSIRHIVQIVSAWLANGQLVLHHEKNRASQTKAFVKIGNLYTSTPPDCRQV